MMAATGDDIWSESALQTAITHQYLLVFRVPLTSMRLAQVTSFIIVQVDSDAGGVGW